MRGLSPPPLFKVGGLKPPCPLFLHLCIVMYCSLCHFCRTIKYTYIYSCPPFTIQVTHNIIG